MIAAISAFGLKAQEGTKPSGNKMWLGGTLGFGTNSIKDGRTGNNWIVGPSFGRMINSKMAIGLNLNVSGSTIKEKNLTADVTKTSGWNAAPFFRYYFAGVGNFKFFGDAYVSVGGGKEKLSNNLFVSSETKYSNFGAGISPGIQYWFNPNWSIASTIGALAYTNTTSTPNIGKSTVTSTFDAKVDFSRINFSCFWHF